MTRAHAATAELADEIEWEPLLLRRLGDIREVRQASWSRDLDAYPFGYVVDEPAGPLVAGVDGRVSVNVGSNNYLGLTTHPLVVEAATAALRRWGTGCSGSRILNGTTSLHAELEEELADFLGFPSALVTTTGYAANTAALTGVLGREDWAVCDRDVHHSIGEGVTLSGARSTRFAHNHVGALRRRLGAVDPDAGVMVVVEGVYSVDGTIAPLSELAAAARDRGAALLVDDAHGVGVMGPGGRGVAEAQHCTASVDLLTTTFSKALGSCGGAVLGSATTIDAIRHRAGPYLFMASNVPAALGAALAALRVLRATPELPTAARRNGRLLREAVVASGWPVAPGEAPIVSIALPNSIAAVTVWRLLLELGVYCNVQLPPAVPQGHAALRLSAMATHAPEHIDRVHDALVEARRAAGRLRATTAADGRS